MASILCQFEVGMIEAGVKLFNAYSLLQGAMPTLVVGMSGV